MKKNLYKPTHTRKKKAKRVVDETLVMHYIIIGDETAVGILELTQGITCSLFQQSKKKLKFRRVFRSTIKKKRAV